MSKQKRDLAAAMEEDFAHIPAAEAAPDRKKPAVEKFAAKTEKKPSRKATKFVGGHYDPKVSHQLGLLCAELKAKGVDTSNQKLVAEGLNMLFEKYGKPPIAQ